MIHLAKTLDCYEDLLCIEQFSVGNEVSQKEKMDKKHIFKYFEVLQ